MYRIARSECMLSFGTGVWLQEICLIASDANQVLDQPDQQLLNLIPASRSVTIESVGKLRRFCMEFLAACISWDQFRCLSPLCPALLCCQQSCLTLPCPALPCSAISSPASPCPALPALPCFPQGNATPHDAHHGC